MKRLASAMCPMTIFSLSMVLIHGVMLPSVAAEPATPTSSATKEQYTDVGVSAADL